MSTYVFMGQILFINTQKCHHLDYIKTNIKAGVFQLCFRNIHNSYFWFIFFLLSVHLLPSDSSMNPVGQAHEKA